MSSGTEPSPEALIAALKEMIVEECDRDESPGDIDSDELLIGGAMELDSLDALQICMAVKETYGVRIEGGPEARAALQSVRALAQTIIDETGQ